MAYKRPKNWRRGNRWTDMADRERCIQNVAKLLKTTTGAAIRQYPKKKYMARRKSKPPKHQTRLTQARKLCNNKSIQKRYRTGKQISPYGTSKKN